METGDRTKDENGKEILWINRNDSPGAPLIPREETEGKWINGKYYPMWQQFVDRKAEWIGGVLEDHDMGEVLATEITDIDLIPNGETSAMFCIHGKDFDCTFDVQYGGIIAGEPGWLTFHMIYMGIFRIKKKGE